MTDLNIDSKLLEIIKGNDCFGIAYDESAPECKQCDVKCQCRSRCQGENAVLPPKKIKNLPKVEEPSLEGEETTSEEKSKKTIPNKKEPPKKRGPKPAPPKVDTPVNPNMPNFKDMKMEQLVELANEHNISYKDYGSDNITRMRLIMSLKQLYK